MELIQWLRNTLHRLPHFDFSFHQVDNVFVYDVLDPYSAFLVLLAIFALAIGALFLFCLVIVWIASCCTSKGAGGYSRRSVRRLTIFLFLLNVVCFVLLAACLYGNDYLTRSVITRVSPQMREVHNNLQIANNKLFDLHNAYNNVSTDVSQIKTAVEEKARRSTANQTLINGVNRELDKIVSLWKELRKGVEVSQKSLFSLVNLEYTYKSVARWEFERWILMVTLLSIMFVVLFIGVLAICKKSRTAIVAFSGLGIVIFVLAWTIFSVMLPISVAFADFCETKNVFLSHYFPEGIYNTLHYYEKCVPDNTYTDTSGDLHLDKIDALLSDLKKADVALQQSTQLLFADDPTTKSLVFDISTLAAEGYKKIGIVSTLASCSSNHHRVHDIVQGFCQDGFAGNTISLVSIFFFGVFMAILLMVASRGWFAFERLPSDYDEMNTEDPFYPRQDNNIPPDIYGTHVFNPRSRFATNSADNNTESTGTNSGGHGAIGEQRTPLLEHSKCSADFQKAIGSVNPNESEDPIEMAMEPHFESNLKVNFPLKIPNVDRYLTKDIPHTAVDQFQRLLRLFVVFVNKREFKRVDHIRQTQASLPIAVSREEILGLLKKHNVILLAGDTGCGKSTQLPQYLLLDGYNKIACTQPRRIACMALAKRVGEEMLNQLGSEIAFQTRFEKTKTMKTRVLFITDGLLIRQMAVDPLLSQYDVILLDEVHERNLTGDLLVALMKLAVQRRPDLKLILMSATINLELFSSYFEDAPVVKVPVDERGDMLIFLNGIGEITILAAALKDYAEFTKKWIILMLHSTLSVEEQNKVFDVAPKGVRKCILSTNIAETSVTIDEIRFVIDSGKVNLIKFDPLTRTQHLTECWISQASADQRKGRAGRTGPGVCYRLFSSEQFDKMEPFTPSEIKRVSLESLIMQILNMNLQIDVRDFPFLEAPAKDALSNAMESLQFQKVIDPTDTKNLSPLGHILADLPVDVLMLIYGVIFGELDVILTIAAGLSVQSAFTNRSFRDFECIQNRQHLVCDIGDPFTLVQVYREWIYLRRKREDTKKWARRCGIEETRLYEVVKLRRQFKQILEQSGLLNSRANKEWEALSSRERRVKIGEKRKLVELKKKVFNETRKRRLLKEDAHYDTILDEESEAANPQDDVNSLEFQVLVDDTDAQSQYQTHKWNEERATIVKFILAVGLYPQYAIEDLHNNHQDKKEQFCHVATKPFSILHPNSVLGQQPGCLEITKDSDGFSNQHQLIFYGLLLETAKPFLCNTTRIPAFFILIFARNITKTSTKIIRIDGYGEFIFKTSDHLEEVLNQALTIRNIMSNALYEKLSGEDVADQTREFRRRLVKFSHLTIEFSGVFDMDGTSLEQFEESSIQEDIKNEYESDEMSLPTFDEVQSGAKVFHCDICKKRAQIQFKRRISSS
ncbi:hypothetical protein M3Y98_00277500 [Aphelenchoides besseyi]|nr:hypothetical protein M3Y98_00277500 [Aphelenchoides besseyi]